ncbi:hypothetical protein PC9H_009038 [Pleurotus ostreatus]|uniref:Uncharacterized protein n=1 Tax=Pleurotus ostreatus TaxID=5322 RepID=A0A8H6ZST1_PLEOS|nr:uncharacterized protein PC9H_009038 [Pleurotus ostreatus]KAF7426669.1 hypothetical protein PC9H_009038 [Pleurotus ostreatus]
MEGETDWGIRRRAGDVGCAEVVPGEVCPISSIPFAPAAPLPLSMHHHVRSAALDISWRPLADRLLLQQHYNDERSGCTAKERGNVAGDIAQVANDQGTHERRCK